MCMCAPIWACVHCECAIACGGQRVLDCLELGLQAVMSHLMWVLGTEPWSFGTHFQPLSHLSSFLPSVCLSVCLFEIDSLLVWPGAHWLGSLSRVLLAPLPRCWITAMHSHTPLFTQMLVVGLGNSRLFGKNFADWPISLAPTFPFYLFIFLCI